MNSFYHYYELKTVEDLMKILDEKKFTEMPSGTQPIGLIQTDADESIPNCVLIDVVNNRTNEGFYVRCTKTDLVAFSQWAGDRRIPLVNGRARLFYPSRG